MTVKITFFPVGNGDMTLIETDSKKKILIDCRIRQNDDYPNALEMLRDALGDRQDGKKVVDLFVWSHPDKDHCQGIEEHFHLGPPEEWSDEEDLIFINEIWSSPMVYKRANRTNNKLCDDAKALRKEVKRRVELFEDKKQFESGDRVLVLGEDENGNTDNIQDIVLHLDECCSKINGSYEESFEARLLGPASKAELDEEEETLGKNHSSVIINYCLSAGGKSINFLSGGDAEVACWESLEKRLSSTKILEYLDYDILQAPHHCSWHSLSRDSLSDKGEDAEVCEEAMNALNRVKDGGFIVSSSEMIEDNEKDPPAFRAKKEYESILEEKKGDFKCVANHKKNGKNIPMVITFNGDEVELTAATSAANKSGQPSEAVNRAGGDGYA
ncbi:hypothetical protein [Idiomarina sp. HP20-50]|uniref:hypothetical protein n=1 Tax=Idiomarina sp. HP20-50 TaxID=3070813 RepID=UPI00294B7C6C|nr:hypothetical protein [Idiomarina sp. HP20-50]MDV6315729.1 hypothetical protein [Idiomarina sp. HP20-50]